MIGDLPFFFVLTPLLGVRAGITSSTSDEADSSMFSSGHITESPLIGIHQCHPCPNGNNPYAKTQR